MSEYTQSRNEDLLRAIIDDTEYESEYTQGENEEILQSIVDGTEYTKQPQSRIAALLLELKAKIEAGGNYEAKTITPDFSNGDVTVLPGENYDALSSVTINKDADLIAENIKKDVDVFGIVGTLEAGGGDLDALIDRSITSIENNVSTIGDYAFYYCTNLTSASFPNATSIGTYAFFYCTNLTSASFPNATSIGTYAFYNCRYLTNISFPNVTSIGKSAFENNIRLVSATFFKAVDFASMIFYNCTVFNTLVLKANSVSTLTGTQVFNGTKFAAKQTGGTIYVPQDLIASYQADTNWSAVLGLNANNQILPIEGSIYE